MARKADPRKYWERASGSWDTFGSPLRPVKHDLESIAQAVSGWPGRAGGPRVLILGVTPEYYHLWPEGTDVLAVDKNPRMIETLWPGPPETVRCADWLTMDLPDQSRDIVLCDGGFPVLIPPGEQSKLVDGLRRIVAPSGRIAFRCHVLPRRPETTGEVIDDLLAGKIGSANVLKVRLWMTVSDDPRREVRVSDVWEALERAVPDLDALSERLGWPPDGLRQFASYRDSADCYYLRSIEEIVAMFCDGGGFRYVDAMYPPYELGERCPVLVFEKI